MSQQHEKINNCLKILCGDVPKIIKEKEKIQQELNKVELENESNITHIMNLNLQIKKLKKENKKLVVQNQKLLYQQLSQQQLQQLSQQLSQQQLQQLSESEMRGPRNTRLTRKKGPYINDDYDSQQQKQKDILRQLKYDKDLKKYIKDNKINLAELGGKRHLLDKLVSRLKMTRNDRQHINNLKKIFDLEGPDLYQKSNVVQEVQKMIVKYDPYMKDIIYYEPKIHWKTRQRKNQL